MDTTKFRNYFEQIKNNEHFFARPIFNDEFMSRLGELFSKKNYSKFKSLIEKDDIPGLRNFLKKYYQFNNYTKNTDFYNKTVSIEFDICLDKYPETEHPYYLGFYSDSIPLYKVIKILQIYFSNNEPNYWLTGIINSSGLTNDYIDAVAINGQLMFGASPISELNATLYFDQHTAAVNDKNELTKVYFNLIDKYNNILYSNENPLTEKDIQLSVKCISCYNIGQGNCIRLNGINDERIYFDVGLTRYSAEKQQKEIKSSISELKQEPPDVIILSHWDTDHIMGLSLWDDNVYTKKWIIPDIRTLWFKATSREKRKSNNKEDYIQKDDIQERKTKYISSYAFRIYLRLIQSNSNNIYLISEKLEQKCIYRAKSPKNIILEIWTGKRIESGSKSTHIINRANNFGLIMRIYNNCRNAILCGDCDYRVIPDSLKNDTKYDCVIVSHHGSKMGEFPFKSNQSFYSEAIVSYGICNTFGHPNGSKMTEISKKGYKIITTVGRSKYIIPIHCNYCSRLTDI